jgi:plasmid replication initiation protein
LKHWFSGNLYPLSIQIPTKRSGPLKEINLLTDVIVKYEPIKQGRAVHDVKFTITRKSQDQIFKAELQIDKRIDPNRAAQLEKGNTIEVPLFNWLNESE